jgi:TIR domain
VPARDVFLCHASGDKQRYARPLAKALARRAVSCWIDEAEIEIGDSIIDAVNTGLRLSHFVLVIITEESLSRRWPQRELNAALYKEMISGRTVVLPVLAISPARWIEEYPLLADKLFLKWSEGLESLAEAIAQLFKRTPTKEWAHNHPRDYRGLIWVRCTPATWEEKNAILTLRWGPYVKTVPLTFSEGMPVSLLHHKTNNDSVTLHASIEPASIVTFGVGPAPDVGRFAENIDEGWTRAAGMDVKHPTFPQSGEPPRERDLLAEMLDHKGEAEQC